MENLKEIMARDIVCTLPSTSLEEIAKMMVDYDCGEIPLVENDQDKKVVGVITDRDIVCRTLGVGKNPMKLTAKDCMSSPPVTATFDMAVDDCIELMEEHKIRRIPIVDENGSLCGMVSQADLVQEIGEEDATKLIQEVSTPTSTPSEIH